MLTTKDNTQFILPDLPYAADALEPHIDAATMEIHHGKHHRGYVDKLNAALANQSDFMAKELDELLIGIEAVPEDIRLAVRNNGGGHYNHTLFWESMTPGGADNPSGDLSAALDEAFGSYDAFTEKFTDAAMSRFGSGWAWLSIDGAKLVISSTQNQDTPLMNDMTPLLGLDVWEHAYYLKYQNKRAEYIAAWWRTVNWDVVMSRFAGLHT